MIRRLVVFGLMLTLLNFPGLTYADKKDHKKGENRSAHLHALITDVDGVQTELNKVKLYWEEKIDETSFVPHKELHISVKRGKATVEIGLEKIQIIEVLPKQDTQVLNVLRITLNSGSQGEFPLARDVSLIGHSDFGKMQVPLADLAKIELK